MHNAMCLDPIDESLCISSSLYISGRKVLTRHFSFHVYILACTVLVGVGIDIELLLNYANNSVAVAVE